MNKDENQSKYVPPSLRRGGMRRGMMEDGGEAPSNTNSRALQGDAFERRGPPRGRGGGMGRSFVPRDDNRGDGLMSRVRRTEEGPSGDAPEAPAVPRRNGVLDLGAPASRPGSRIDAGEEKKKEKLAAGKNRAVDETGEPVDTVKAWKERGKRPDRNFNIEEESRLIFGDPDAKKSGGSGINFDSFFDIPVSLTGEDGESIAEIPSFQQAGASIHELLMENIGRIGYNKPTPVQKWSIPCIFAGRDLMACAQTGSGKTAAFLFPIISKMLNDGPPLPATYHGRPRMSSSIQKPNALVLSPTRELATQIYDEAKKFCFNTGIRPVVVYGGQAIREQFMDMRLGCDVCIATPGRLIDHVSRSGVCLSECHYFVLDEADRMLDMGFAPQITEIVDNCRLPSKDVRQTIMFSATFPAMIQKLAEEFMDEYLFLTVGRVGSTNECITQIVLYADERAKPTRLIGLLNEVEGLTLIFVDTKKKADIIHEYLSQNDIGAVSIHGDRTQQEREEALEMFRSGEASVMVATDVVGRGLDIPNVTHVINHDMPPSIDDYVHRIGRTGRAGNKGRATTFITEFNGSVLRDLVTVLEEAKQDTPQWLLDMVSSGSSFKRGGLRGGGGRGAFGARDMRNDVSAYGLAMDQGRGAPRGMAVDHRYNGHSAMGRGGMQGGAMSGGAHGGYRTVTKKKAQVEDDNDGW